jgi:hypothetical protein
MLAYEKCCNGESYLCSSGFRGSTKEVDHGGDGHIVWCMQFFHD